MMRKVKLSHKILSSVLALLMVFTSFPIINTYAAVDENLGQVSAITKPAEINDTDQSEIIVKYNDEITLDRSPKNADRAEDGWWVGINMNAPNLGTEVLSKAKYKSKASYNSSLSKEKSFWDFRDSKDKKDDEKQYITLWSFVTEKKIADAIENNKGILETQWLFDWNYNGTFDGEQSVTVQIDALKVKLMNGDEQVYPVLPGTVTAITNEKNADVNDENSSNITVTYNGKIELDWSDVDENTNMPRTKAGWWTGIKMTAPNLDASVLKNATYDSLANGTTEWVEGKKFWKNQDSKETDEQHYITLWTFVNEEDLNDALTLNNSIATSWRFDWDNDGIVDQTVTTQINLSEVEVILNKDNKQVYPAKESGTVTGITGTPNINNDNPNFVTVSYDDKVTLQWSQASNETNLPRPKDGWWAGIKMTAPQGADLENAKYKSKATPESKWIENKSFWSNKDSKEDAKEHFITLWAYVANEDMLKNGINTQWGFDWDNDGVYEQYVDFKFDSTNVNLDYKNLYTMDENAPVFGGDINNTDEQNVVWVNDPVTISGSVTDFDEKYVSGIKEIYYAKGEHTGETKPENAANLDLVDGKFSFEVTDDYQGWYTIVCVDNAGNIATQKVYVKIDNTAPEFKNVTPNITEWKKGSITIEGTVIDTLSKVKSVEYSQGKNGDKNPANLNTETGAFSFEIPSTITYSGEYYIYCTDNARKESVATVLVNIDNEKCIVVLNPNSKDWTNKPVIITGSIQDNHSGIGSIFYRKSLEDDLNNLGNLSGTKEDIEVKPNADGSFVINLPADDYAGNYTVYGKDKVGNISNGVTFEVNMDKTAPKVNSVENPTDWTNQNVTVKGSVSDELSKVKAVFYKLVDDEIWSEAVLNGDGKNYSFEIEKQNYNDVVQVYCVDNADNKSEVATSTLFMDTEEPNPVEITYSTSVIEKILKAVTFGFYQTACEVTLTSTDNLSGIKSFDYSIDGGKTFATINRDSKNFKISDKSATATFIINPEFIGNVTATATDNSGTGNTSVSVTDEKTVVVDNTSPEISVKYISEEGKANFINAENKFVNSLAEAEKVYYNKAVSAEITIDEENFFEGQQENVGNESSKITAHEVGILVEKTVDNKTTYIEYLPKTAEGAQLAEKKYSEAESVEYFEWDSYETLHTAKIDFADDADYKLIVEYTDYSANNANVTDDNDNKNEEQKTYESKIITVDTTAPIVTVSYDNNRVVNEKYFNAARKATITVEEHNFFPQDIVSVFTAVDVNNNPVGVEDYAAKLVDIKNWYKEGNTYTTELAYIVDANYTFSFDYTDKSDNKMEFSYAEDAVATEEFTVDTVKPENLTIEYSDDSVFSQILDKLTFGFYKSSCHVTITAKDTTAGVDFFNYNYDLQKEDVHTANQAGSAEKVVPIVDENDKSVYTYAFNIPEQFRGDVKASVTDKSGNASSAANEGIVVTDTIAPTLNITYSTPNEEHNGIVYYGTDVTATIEVTEENFMDGEYPEDVKDIQISADIVDENGIKTIKTYEVNDWIRVNNTDVWQGHFTMTDEGDYTLKINYSDKSQNAAEEYIYEKTICIDKTAPVVTVSYDNNKAVNEKYFNAARKATITVEEHNFFPQDIVSVFTAVDVNNNPVGVEDYAAKLVDIKNWYKEGNTYTTELAYIVDANYTFSFDYTDKSDNKMEFSYAEDAVATEEFTVDTVKPEITLSTSIPIVYRILNALTFGIFNPEAKVVITTTDLTSGIDYVTYQSTSVEGKEIGNIDIKTVKSSEMQINDVLKEKAVYSFNIPAEFRNTLIAYAYDKAWNHNYTTVISSTNDNIIYDGIIADNSAKSDLIKLSVDENAKYASKDTFAADFNFHASIEDINSGIGDVNVYINNVLITEDNEGKSISDLYAADKNENSLIEKIDFSVNTSQINSVAADGVYTLRLVATDNAGNKFENSYTAYIDVYAPMITDFSFDTNGEAYYGDEAYEMGEKADPVGDNSIYNCYFQKDTKVTVYAYDYEQNGANPHTAGIEDIKLIAVNADGTTSVYNAIDSSFVQTTNDGIGYSQKTFNIAGPFKGDIYAIASDYAGNFPTNDESKGIILDTYKPLMSSIYEGYVAPYDTILENEDKHYNTSGIVIKPNSDAPAVENYKFTPNSEIIGSKGQQDKKDNDTYNVNNNVPLYQNDTGFTINVSDNYSGIKKIAWKVVGQEDQDSRNNQSGEVKVNNAGGLSGDSGWIKVKNDNNLVTEMSKSITVKNNSNDITIVVELTDRAGNISYDYYVLGIDKTKPSIQVTVDGDANNSKYFSTSRTVEIVVTERNFNESLVDIIMTDNDNDISFKGSDLRWSDSTSNINATDSTTHTVKYTIDDEGDYSLQLKAKDIAGNDNNAVQYLGDAPTNFVIDKVSPEISVSMSGTSQNKANYFNENREVIIEVTDRNFDDSNVNLVITKDGQNYSQNLTWNTDQSGSNRTNATKSTARFTISEEGDYTFAISCNDLANNTSSQTNYATSDCERFTIDKTAPTVTVTGVSYMSANNGKKDGQKISIPLTVSVNDANIGNYYANNEIDRNDLVETLQYSTLNSTETYSGFALSQSSRTDAVYAVSNIETNGIYVLNLNIQDCAGNKITTVTYNTDENSTAQQSVTNGTTDFFRFSVNRNGSAYSINGDTQKLIETHYVQHVENDVVINEVNVDELQGDLKGNVRITKNGELIDAGSYINVEHVKNSSSWNNYIYTIDKNCFNDEATYTLSVESKDSAANDGYSELILDEKINFIVDRTIPVATITGVTEGATYVKESQSISVKVNDDVLLSKVVIKLNGEVMVDTSVRDNLEEYMTNNQFEWKYDVKSSGEAQNISVECYDAAENTNVDSNKAPKGLEVDNFLVSVEFAPRVKFWISNNIIIFVLICVAIIALIVCIVLLIIYKKKNKKTEK